MGILRTDFRYTSIRDEWKLFFPLTIIANCLYHMNGLLHAWSNLSFCFVTLIASTKCFTSQYNK
nr:MAG TPA: hypothetical protein [Caudoviricetes sp.]DAV47557.1 MAG TPA: hypothetical protein [Caudoviricetes sp.]